MFKYATTALLATLLWVMPSVGTRGQGTLGDRFIHVDQSLVTADVAGQRLLQHADVAVGAAVKAL